MKRYYQSQDKFSSSTSTPPPTSDEHGDSLKRTRDEIEVDLDKLPADPGLRKQITEYPVKIRDEVRRAYVLKGPFQPRDHPFPQKRIGNYDRRFIEDWFDEFPNWLEYSIAKDAAFCLCCYLFKSGLEDGDPGDSFVCGGFSNWKKKERLYAHIGGLKSYHNLAWTKYQNILNQKQHIQTAICKQTDEARNDYRIRLTASIDCIRFLLCQGLAFRGHDESEISENKGNFLELLEFLCHHDASVRAVALKSAPDNLKLTSPKIQKDIVCAAAAETTKSIITDIGDAFFSVLIDESRDVSSKEQMAVVLRYVDKKGSVIERFLGLKHVPNTSAQSLKDALEELFYTHGLSISRVRGQGYDGASNMQGEFNGLKALIMKENPYAYFIHCFAHQLQLALVGVARHHLKIGDFFNMVSSVVNVVGASCKRRNILMEKQAEVIREAINNDEVQCGKGLNQETTLKRAGDTRWGSHYGSLVNFITMFSAVVDVVEMVKHDGENLDQRIFASALFDSIQTFEFVFNLHLMRYILGITNELSLALQRKDQDIANAMILVKISKQRLQTMRETGWEALLDEVSSFCGKHHIVILNMEDKYVEAFKT